MCLLDLCDIVVLPPFGPLELRSSEVTCDRRMKLRSRVMILPEPGASPSLVNPVITGFAQSGLTQRSDSGVFTEVSSHWDFCTSYWPILLMRRAAVKQLNIWMWGGRRRGGRKKHFFWWRQKSTGSNRSCHQKMLLNTPHHRFIRTGSIITDEENCDKTPGGASRAGPGSAPIHGVFVNRASALFLSWITQSWRQEFRKLGV